MINHPKNICLVESDRALADLIRLSFSRLGVECTVINGFEVALPTIQRMRPDLLLLDLFLPDGNGLELLRTASISPGMENMPVIVISAYGFKEIVDQARQNGAVDFVIKPFNVDTLVDKTRRWLFPVEG